MAKRERSARVLQEEASRRIQKVDEIADEGARIRVPLPQAHPRDARGRNWDIKGIGKGSGHERAVREVVDRLRDEFDLGEAPAGSAPNPFGD
ncbi:hypothetical protein BKK79_31640 [Cupriavidus sp. USMAA2-4]|uniref:Uncharacterized protein n=1 Tax=Cupriavidus malaysiensis TaxID=367825 RepID=A0ABN4TVQ2_9BURK|nr:MULTISPECIES: hypothetical protein [Cupriavidus]AOY96178.1 hypothetical protein BKK79_31640 [Cupriavidus sp. USMAA2-4]AOZ03420.1 hypothetical protein BKK81_30590 [Cupriavidus sp. USMAHM13]AOZ09218.1 hypothetical protein BKK80_25765 [Cupriavidus malaysiensis]